MGRSCDRSCAALGSVMVRLVSKGGEVASCQRSLWQELCDPGARRMFFHCAAHKTLRFIKLIVFLPLVGCWISCKAGSQSSLSFLFLHFQSWYSLAGNQSLSASTDVFAEPQTASALCWWFCLWMISLHNATNKRVHKNTVFTPNRAKRRCRSS